MYEHISMSERIDRVGALLAKAVHLYNKKVNEEVDSEEVDCGKEDKKFNNNG